MAEEKEERTMMMMTECWSCTHKCSVPGNCHIRCNDPDPDMTGDRYGKQQGWFFYPTLFDPAWKTKLCSNFTQVEGD